MEVLKAVFSGTQTLQLYGSCLLVTLEVTYNNAINVSKCLQNHFKLHILISFTHNIDTISVASFPLTHLAVFVFKNKIKEHYKYNVLDCFLKSLVASVLVLYTLDLNPTKALNITIIIIIKGYMEKDSSTLIA